MIAGTTGPFAVHAGLQVLTHGGTAADAALTTSLAQIALTAGAAISYAGIMTAVYYEAASGKVYALDAGYNTVRNEKDPITIPSVGEHSGRTALIPGFMAGVQALHDRFGKLPFATLFEPAIWIAEKGFAFTPVMHGWLFSEKEYITRLPEAKRVFTKQDGDLYRQGDPFRQPELAATLRNVAKHGASYMYRGEWARHFVDIVQREGGKATLEDMAAYRPELGERPGMPYRGYQIVAPDEAIATLLALKMAEAADLKQYGHYTRSPEALYYLMQMHRVGLVFTFGSEEALRDYFPGVDPAPASRLTTQTAERLWARIRRTDWQNTMAAIIAGKPAPGHSAGVVAVDRQGNVASIIHTINCINWGATGMFVDGVSIPDSAAFQQQMIARVGPGARLPHTTNPLLVLNDGKPVLASSAIGTSLHEATVQHVMNILDFSMDPFTAVNLPNTRGPFIGRVSNRPEPGDLLSEAVADGDFTPAVLDGVRARGQAIKIVSPDDQAGSWIGIQIDPVTRKLRGATTPHLPALVEGY